MCRPEKKIDWERVDQMLQAGCLGTEIAAIYDIHADTFYRRVQEKFGISFTDYCHQRRWKGDSIIREAQFKKAVKKLDNTMLIWLGKQRLGQRENALDKVVSEETANNFIALMQQLTGLQDERKSAPINEIKEDKSECVTGENLAEGGKESIF